MSGNQKNTQEYSDAVSSLWSYIYEFFENFDGYRLSITESERFVAGDNSGHFVDVKWLKSGQGWEIFTHFSTTREFESHSDAANYIREVLNGDCDPKNWDDERKALDDLSKKFSAKRKESKDKKRTENENV